MPHTADSVDIPSEAAAVARRYRRPERFLSALIALLVGATGAAAVLFLPLVRALPVAAAALLLVRIPVVRTAGNMELVTDADPEAVRADFESATPPVLPFQWGLADTVRTTTDGGNYEFSYLFGRLSVTMTAEVRLPSSEGGANDDLELVVTAGGQPWATYTIALRDRDGTTVVDVEWVSNRRFGLRRLPQWLVARHYQDEALAVQGYEIHERNGSFRL